MNKISNLQNSLKRMKLVDKYKVEEIIGQGTYGSIYKGRDKVTSEPVAVKIESISQPKKNLAREKQIYALIGDTVGFPKLKYFCTDGNVSAMVISMLGKSLDVCFKEAPNRFSLKTVLLLADQMISRIQYLHSKGIIHRDIKPSNFMMGSGNDQNIVYLIDFGFARSYCNLTTKEHNVERNSTSFIGTPSYASINALKLVEQSRRDDLESLAYTLIYFLKGTLPWNLVRCDNNDFCKRILEVKENTTIHDLCDGLPAVFETFLTSIRELKFEKEPNYIEYREMFRNLFKEKGYIYDGVYDWTRTLKQLPLEGFTDRKLAHWKNEPLNSHVKLARLSDGNLNPMRLTHNFK